MITSPPLFGGELPVMFEVAALVSPRVVSTPHAFDHCPGFARQMRIVGASQRDFDGVCLAMGRVQRFFAQHGLATDRPFLIEFKENVVAPVIEMDGVKSAFSGVRVVGMYDASLGKVSMTTATAPWLRERPYFEVEFSSEILVSVMAHEIAHALSKAFYRDPASLATHAQDEYIAYVVQFSTMDPDERQRILGRYPDVEARFPHELSINDLVHGADPHRFGVMAYRHFTSEHGGAAFLQRIYSGDFRPIDFSAF